MQARDHFWLPENTTNAGSNNGAPQSAKKKNGLRKTASRPDSGGS